MPWPPPDYLTSFYKFNFRLFNSVRNAKQAFLEGDFLARTSLVVLFYLLTSVPALMFALLFFMIARSSENIPHWDEWDFVIPAVQNFVDHGLTFESLWIKSGDHIIAVPRLLYFLNTLLTSFDLRYLHAVNGLTVLIVFVILRKIVNLSFENDQDIFARKWLAPALLCVFSFYLFSLGYPGVYLWGLSSYIFTSILFAACCFGILSYLISQSDKISDLRFYTLLALTFLICLFSVGSSLHSVLLCFSMIIASAFSLKALRRQRSFSLLAVFVLEFILLVSIIKFHHGYNEVHLLSNGLESFKKFILVYSGSNFDVHNMDFALMRGQSIWTISFVLFFALLYTGKSVLKERGLIFFSLLLC